VGSGTTVNWTVANHTIVNWTTVNRTLPSRTTASRKIAVALQKIVMAVYFTELL